jgi:hypothetical protein
MNYRYTTKTNGRRHRQRGAALIIAIAIMTILLAIALTFYAISRQEVDDATNIKNRVQADLLVDSALAIAMAEINRNFQQHPEATSLDHAMFSIFNGSWAVGKQWALWNGVALQNGGIPYVNMFDMPEIEWADGYSENLYQGPVSREWLYYPRYEYDAGAGVSYNYMYVADRNNNPVVSAQIPGTALNFTQYLDGSPFTWSNFDVEDRYFDPADPTPSFTPLFVTPSFYGPSLTAGNLTDLHYPIEWVHDWTDIDNNGDGLKDAIWIPLGRELFFSGGELLNDGAKNRLDDDFIDNDLDGMVDENQENGNDDTDNDGLPDDEDGDGFPDDNDERIEIASFVYNGAVDGLDNDGDGATDEADEDKFFLTSPLPGLRIPVDLNADGLVPDLVPNGATGVLVPLTVTLPNTIGVNYIDNLGAPQTAILDVTDVDVIDNDYDMLANDYHVYAYVGPNTDTLPPPLYGPPFGITGFEDIGEEYSTAFGVPIIRSIESGRTNNPFGLPVGFYDSWLHVGNWLPGDAGSFQAAHLKAYNDIHVPAVFGGPGNLAISPPSGDFWSDSLASTTTFNFDSLAPYLRITHSGEAVCELVGRAAITVRDESAKMNMNVAGAHTGEPIQGYIRALGDGVTPGEIDTRILPDIGWNRASYMWRVLTGYPEDDFALTAAFDEDVIFPGDGRVDDNANILLAALNGKDDDGDGLIDEGLRLPPLGDPLFDVYYAELGAWEGVDESAELQRFRPLPNLQAEGRNPYQVSGVAVDVLNNNNDLSGIINERGELGDFLLKDTLEIKLAEDIGDARYGYMRNSISAYSTDRNTNFIFGGTGIRAVNKLDYNFATPQQIAANLLLTNSYEVTTNRTDVFGAATTDVRFFSAGLLQSDLHIRSSIDVPNNHFGILDGGVEYLPADGVLRAMQAAVDIVDNRDRGHSRSVLTTERMDLVPQDVARSAAVYDAYPLTLSLRERIPDNELFPLEEIENYLFRAMDVSRRLQFEDDWWTQTAGVLGLSAFPEQRKISYTVSGNEAIRINEIMVRPVRRIEAETVTNVLLAADPMNLAASPLTNFDPTPFDLGGNPAILPQFDVDREVGPGIGWVLTDGALLGDTTYISNVVDPAVLVADDTDILEFAIRQETGLPPGHYYLTLDTRIGGLGTVFPQSPGPGVLQAAVKYVDTTIIGAQLGDSIITDVVANGVDQFQQILDPQISDTINGAPGGWAFVDGTQGGAGNAFGYHFDGLPAEVGTVNTQPGLGAGETFTVTVPPGASVYELHVAVRINPAFLATLLITDPIFEVAINALDFSQEPDHEWLELVNESDETVNVGGWEMEVGIPDRDGVPTDPYKSRWFIPLDTEIAPGGMLLLAFGKYDFFQDGGALNNDLFQNGMSLADGDNAPGPLAAFISGASTVPTVFDDTSPTSLVPALQDVSGSVFFRPTDPFTGLVDYIDRDGDGRSSIILAADGDPTTPDTDSAETEASVVSSKELSGILSTANLPWDRIVQLEPSSVVSTVDPFASAPASVVLDDISGLDPVSSFVLRGGVFPNYPERDSVDNDGDGGYIVFNPDADGDLIDDPIYIPGVLDRDMVDNDGDNLIDERGDAIPGVVDDPDPFGIAAGFLGDGVDPRLSEGVDEGAFLLAGDFTELILPVQFLNDRSIYPSDLAYFNTDETSPPGGIPTVIGGGPGGPIAIDVLNAGAALSIFDPLVPGLGYLGTNNDPPDWKAFQERRWYPGDNVIVTLYEGQASDKRVVDRVTYRESDVINRTVDDVVTVPYVAFDGDGIGGITRDEDPRLNVGYPTFWRPNHMGLDFYRSLERKHALHNGDRFGTENRWQATDGNYDDWSDSLSFFERVLASDVSGEPVLLTSDTLATIVQPRFFAAHPTFPAVPVTQVARNVQLFSHAMAGSPLRMNAAARRSEDPPDLELIAVAAAVSDPTTQFPGTLDYFRTHEDGAYLAGGTKTLQDKSWNHEKTLIANEAYQTPGDMMRVPHQMYLHDALNTSGAVSPFLRDATMLNVSVQTGPAFGEYAAQDIALRGATLGQDETDQNSSGNILRETINSMATEPKVLTVGQSEFHPIWPDLAPGDPQNATILDWVPNPNSGDPDDLWAPATWAPVFLFELPQDNVGRSSLDYLPNYPSYDTGVNLAEFVPRHYLFNTAYMTQNIGGYFQDVVTYPDLVDRWTLERRAAVYVSQNRDAALQPAEGLWIWDGGDGLENGEYILYIGTFVPEMTNRIEEAASASANGVFNANLGIDLAAKTQPALLSIDPLAANNTTYSLADGTAVPVSRVTASLLRRDPTNTNPFYSQGQDFEPVYGVDVITDPSEARGRAPEVGAGAVSDTSVKPPGLIHPADWSPSVLYKANDDGYIFYGNNAVGGWRPQIVRVTDNFLALRVRNLGNESQLGALTHIVLAPRKRTAGRINANTAESRVVQRLQAGTGNVMHEYVSTMMGLPGVVDVARTVEPSTASTVLPTGALDPFDDIALMDQDDSSGTFPSNDPGQPDDAWSRPNNLYNGVPLSTPPERNVHDFDVTTDSDLLARTVAASDAEAHRTGSFRLNAMLMAGRREHADGRYFDSLGDLVLDSSAFDYNFAASRADIPDLSGLGFPNLPAGVENAAIYPLSNEALPSKRFDEVFERFRRMGNSLTVRSDVYEIIMTVEAGYGVDRDGDGVLNYRDPNEFNTTAATKASAIYERRTPSDQSDGGE